MYVIVVLPHGGQSAFTMGICGSMAPWGAGMPIEAIVAPAAPMGVPPPPIGPKPPEPIGVLEPLPIGEKPPPPIGVAPPAPGPAEPPAPFGGIDVVPPVSGGGGGADMPAAFVQPLSSYRLQSAAQATVPIGNAPFVALAQLAFCSIAPSQTSPGSIAPLPQSVLPC
jgi:hypothetical protein